jgi:hypothetical protein
MPAAVALANPDNNQRSLALEVLDNNGATGLLLWLRLLQKLKWKCLWMHIDKRIYMHIATV